MGLSNDLVAWDWVIEDTFPYPGVTCITEVREYTNELINKYGRFVRVVALDFHQVAGSGFQYIAWSL